MNQCQHARRFVLLSTQLIILTIALSVPRFSWAAKNVILMISDGGGHNAWLAASMYRGRVDREVYDDACWLRLSCTTYPLNRSSKPTGEIEQNPTLVYDPARAWDTTIEHSKSKHCSGYKYLKSTYTDSAAAATALATGRKTYNKAINWSSDDRPRSGQTIAEIAKSQGKAVGVITSVFWSHATPAGLGGAHNTSRGNYAEIANEMLHANYLDVIMGAGNPDYDDDGRLITDIAKRNYQCVGDRKTWQALKQGKLGWKLIESKADFEALASGPTPAKVLGTAQVAATLQEKRDSNLNASSYDKVAADLSPKQMSQLPFTTPLNANVPSLSTMSKAALNCLDDDPDGFFLMIEGGAVDWAGHANEPDRLIEEQIDFVEAVETVVAWIESHGGWRDTLLILTADHETGFVWGPDSENIAFQSIEDHGAGKLPGIKFNSHNHSNSLVPLYARGAGSWRFCQHVDGFDPTAAAKWNTSGQYVDNTDIFQVMQAEITATEYRVPCKRCRLRYHTRPMNKRWRGFAKPRAVWRAK